MKKTFKFSILALLIAALTASMLMISASAASLEELSKEIKAGEVIKEQFYSSSAKKYYKINVSEKGELKLSFDTTISLLWFDVYNGKGEKLDFSDKYAEIGAAGHNFTYRAELKWNDNVEKSEGFFIYNVNEGAYYIEVQPWYLGNGAMKMSAEFPSSDTPATKSIRLKITLNEGDALRLGAVIDPEDAEEPKWTSSNKEVATVSKSGKITAVSAGTATIKCKSGGKTLRVKLVVEES